MDGQIEKQNENQENNIPSDPWATAFAALDKEANENIETTPDPGDNENGDGTATQSTDGATDTAPVAQGNSTEPTLSDGGSDTLGEVGGSEASGTLDDLFKFTEEEITEYKESLQKNIEDQTIRDVAKAFIDRGARNADGRLGASLNDPDICKRDSNGVPRFYNPDTGREFTGDNPRRQAQEWVNDYNKELAESFNKTCADYSKKLLEEQGHGLAVIEFAPKYEKLDPVRKAMFESIIEDYEIHDSDGDLVGYSCDLDKALNAVNRQVKTMQTRFSSNTPPQNNAPSGPVLDMKSQPANDDGKVPQFKSIAEAMEYQQDQLLKNLREKDK